MEYTNFINILSWIFGAFNLFLMVCKKINETKYPGSITQMGNRLRGIKRTWVYKYNLIVFLICVSWIISY